MSTATISPAQHATMMQTIALDERRRGLPVSERNVLVVLSEAVLSGVPIDPGFQALANAIVAKAVIAGNLTARKKEGRPQGIKGHDAAMVTTEFYELLDGVGSSEMTESEAELELALLYDVDVSTIKRAVQSEKWLHGDSKAAREQARRSNALLGVSGPQAEVDDTGLVELACLEKDEALAQLQATIRGRPSSMS
ncbi:hypothetical protein [Variovorax paradoxus]|uniref:hypothetical protein n=1 Tax=Variovorax paradoxus TaxID=34073 RepID=UPI0027873094|nr:hypothetical protein [Variovorax paradoxus]MDQ0590989.1 hypothetical protein [Variovorax paradoxus]